jgi:hypothetical protein
MRYVSRTSVLYTAVVIALLAALPGAILTIIRTGDPYLFTEGFFLDMLARLSGPGRLRFIIQPSVAVFLGLPKWQRRSGWPAPIPVGSRLLQRTPG